MENENNIIKDKEQQGKAKKKIGTFLLGLVGVGLLYGAYWQFYASNFEDTENAYVSGNQNLITSSIGGNVVGVYINDGVHTNKSDIAIKIEDTDFKINLKKAENNLIKAVRGYRSLQINKNQSQENLNLKIKDLNKAKIDFDRDSAAFKGGIISKEQFDNTKYKYEQAQLNLENAKFALDNSKIQAFSKDLETHPEVQSAINEYRQAYIDLKRTLVKIPQEGIVAKKSVYLGQKINQNQGQATLKTCCFLGGFSFESLVPQGF